MLRKFWRMVDIAGDAFIFFLSSFPTMGQIGYSNVLQPQPNSKQIMGNNKASDQSTSLGPVAHQSPIASAIHTFFIEVCRELYRNRRSGSSFSLFHFQEEVTNDQSSFTITYIAGFHVAKVVVVSQVCRRSQA